MKDLEAEARKDPGNFSWTSLGGTGGQDYLFRQFFKAIGIDLRKTKPVMAPGGSQALALVAGGHVKVGSSSPSGAIASIRAKAVRPIAVVGKHRSAGLPDVLTTEEQGYPGVSFIEVFGFSGPPKMPQSIIDTWNRAVKGMLGDPVVLTKMKGLEFIPFHQNEREFRERVVREIGEVRDLWGLK